jgi:hypothetical protein
MNYRGTKADEEVKHAKEVVLRIPHWTNREAEQSRAKKPHQDSDSQ